MDDLIKAINDFKKEDSKGYLLSFACGWMKGQVESASSKLFTSKEVLNLLEVLRENNA